MGDVTTLLDRWNAGDQQAMQELLSLVYAELRQMADRALRRERDDHTLQPTALVHELYLRFSALRDMRVESRRHFYGAAAEAMRRILVDHARMRRAQKRGGADAFKVSLDEVPEGALATAGAVDVERLDDALNALARVAPDKVRVVELRYFAGLSIEETAAVLGLSIATVKRHWAFARAWLYREMTQAGRPGPGAA
ncbi:MAG: sigma-70 family RNA polymerase sigma factor [Vicinamibacterales bacterium]|jgi:RNA polymerase sigma factor (TIGR02999 family)|nr:sigma-70 family RNA polymerase sigma factor [Vicinamibacterales bacterium]